MRTCVTVYMLGARYETAGCLFVYIGYKVNKDGINVSIDIDHVLMSVFAA